MIKELLLSVFGKKEIRCIRCKLLVIVPKDYHWLKMCPKCKEKIDGLIYLVKDSLGSLGVEL
jgi:hypothetical protein